MRLVHPGGPFWAQRDEERGPFSLKSNTIAVEWPPKSARQQEFPEIDQAQWFGTAVARQKILKGQAPFP